MQFWFLGSLIMIYAILPILHKYIYINKKRHKFMLIGLFILCIGIDFCNIILGCNGYSIITVKVIQTFRIWTWMFYFSLGGYIHKYKEKSSLNIRKEIILLLVAIVLVEIYQIIIGKNIYKILYAEYFYYNILIIIYSYLIFDLIMKFNIKHDKLIECINSNTLGMYIIHLPIISVLKKIIFTDKCIMNVIVFAMVISISNLIVSIMRKIPMINKLVKL